LTLFTDEEFDMKFGDKVIIRDGSKVDGCVGIVYRLEEEKAVVLLDKEVLWPVAQYSLELVG
jgi:hypothetical protein